MDREPTCTEVEHGTHSACVHVWEWFKQANRDNAALLEALEDLLTYAEGVRGVPPIHITKARAAIALAKGDK